MIPEGKEIGYECENGHVNNSHSIDHAAEKGMKCVCEECGSLVTRTLIPLRNCRSCGNTWAYGGDADRPTCPACRGKNTVAILETEDRE